MPLDNGAKARARLRLPTPGGATSRHHAAGDRGQSAPVGRTHLRLTLHGSVRTKRAIRPGPSAPGGAHAAGPARGIRRAGAPPRPRKAARWALRRRALAITYPLGPPRDRKDHPRASAGVAREGLPGTALRGVGGCERSARGGRAGGRAPRSVPHAHDPLRRRDPPLLAIAAGRPVAARRGGHRDAHRCHHREPVVRGDRPRRCAGWPSARWATPTAASAGAGSRSSRTPWSSWRPRRAATRAAC